MKQIYNIPSYFPPDLSDTWSLFQTWIKQYLASNFALSQPVEIVSIGENNQFVNVRPLIQQYDTSNKIIDITSSDIIYNIPVMQLFGTDSQITINPSIGDKGLLIGGNFDISNYKKTKSKSPVDSFGSFKWEYGYFLPFSFNQVKNGITLRIGETEMHIQNGLIDIIGNNVSISAQTATVNAQEVNLGGSGGKNIARIGDYVQVDPETHQGTIISGSEIVKAI